MSRGAPAAIGSREVAVGAGDAAGRSAAPRPAALARRRRAGGAGWRRGFAAAVALCLVAYAVDRSFFEPGPGNPLRLGYGIAAALLLVAISLYAVRRRMAATFGRLGLGTSRAWLRLHQYGGVLVLMLVLMHSGFHVPTGLVTLWLWALTLWAGVTGLVGLGLQRWLPRVLGSGLAVEAVYERIPELIGDLRAKAERLAAECSEPVQALYARRVAPELVAPRPRWLYFVDITGGKAAQLGEFDHLRRHLGADEREKLGELARLYKTKLQLDAHLTLQRALRLWPWIHVPASLLVLALLAVHLGTVFLY